MIHLPRNIFKRMLVSFVCIFILLSVGTIRVHASAEQYQKKFTLFYPDGTKVEADTLEMEN